VADEVGDRLERRPGGVHQRDERVPAFVQADRFEPDRERFTAQERSDRSSSPGRAPSRERSRA
jgi:hypothetical protein